MDLLSISFDRCGSFRSFWLFLVDYYLRCAYNHVLLGKNFTALSNSLFNTSKIEDLFRACALSSPVTFQTGNNRIWPDLAFGFVNNRSGSLGWSGISRIHFKQKEKLRAKPISDQSNFQKRPQCERGLNWSTTVDWPKNMENPSAPRPSLRWLRDRERLERFWRVG